MHLKNAITPFDEKIPESDGIPFPRMVYGEIKSKQFADPILTSTAYVLSLSF